MPRRCALGLDRWELITLEQGTWDSLDKVVEAVAACQQDGMPVQLHPGDLGWNWSLGAPELTGSVRVWRRATRSWPSAWWTTTLH